MSFLPHASRRAADLGSLFNRLCFCLGEIGPEFAGDQHRVAELSQRLHEGRFHLAVLGQFKRGKSTLLNALLGEPLLPTSVVPLTAIPTFLRAGRHWEAKESLDVFELPDQPYWITHCWDTLLGLIPPEFFDKFLLAASRRARVRRRLMERVEKLVLHNVEDLRWTTRQSLERTFREFASDIDDRLKETIAATHGAIQEAQSRRHEHAEAVATEIERLEAHTIGLTEVQSALSQADE